MKKLLFLLAALILFAGIADAQNSEFFLYKLSTDGTTVTRTPITRLSYVARTDTTELIYIGGHTNVYLTLGSLDTISAVIQYQFSMDGATWSTATTTDSLVVSSNIALGTKSVNLTTITLGHPFARFLIDINAKPRALGTTTPYYWARAKLTQ